MKGFEWVGKCFSRAGEVSASLVESLTGEEDARREGPPWLRISLVVVTAYLLLTLLLGWFWNTEPEPFDVEVNALAQVDHVVGA